MPCSPERNRSLMRARIGGQGGRVVVLVERAYLLGALGGLSVALAGMLAFRVLS